MKHFIDINDFTKNELRKIINNAKKLKKNKNKNLLKLKNKSLGLLFEKKSLRTRLSFNIGMQKLGGNVIELDADQIGFGTRESDDDILKVMSYYLDFLVVRNDDHRKLVQLASKNILPIVNGLSDFSHPCQILSDIFTIEEKLGPINKQKIVWVGDYNNVLISLIQASEIFKFNLNILTPKVNLKKHKEIFKKKLDYTFFYNDINKGVSEADCIMTDVWFSMGEKKTKTKKKMLSNFQVNMNLMNKAKKNAIFMHCLPAHKNEEVTKDVIEGRSSLVYKQAYNRMYVQQSILLFLIDNVKN